MVVDSIGEPDSYGVAHELMPQRGLWIYRRRASDRFEGSSDLEVMGVVLIPGDVSTAERRLGEKVKKLSFPGGEVSEARDLVAKNTDVRKLLCLELKRRCLRESISPS